MQVICAKCSSPISYEGLPPKFCSECGSSLTQMAGAAATDLQPADTRSMSDKLIGIDSHTDATVPPESTGHGSAKKSDGIVVGDKVGPYSLKRKLGQGGMGSVFEAVHESTGQQVALKLLTCGSVSSNEEAVQRFRRESQIAASINHPRSTFVYESGEHNDQIYITMELMPGGTLQDVVDAEGKLPVNRAVDHILDMVEGLQVAHDAGIVHRDIKPSNSFVDDEGRIKVGDFGLAKSVLGDSSLTRTGTFMGTPQFAAPEQIKSDDIDERTDIYALGGTLFYLIAGRAPFTGNAAQVIASIASDKPPKVSEFASGVPKALTRLIAQTLEKDPAKRPYNLHMLRELLLPYSTSGAFAADIGRRMAAYFLDIVIAAFIVGMMLSFLSPLVFMLFDSINIQLTPHAAGAMLQLPFVILYFAVAEWIFGKTFGKWMFGMRVIDEDGECPKLWQAMVRAILIPGLPMACNLIISGLMFSDMQFESLEDFMMLMVESQAFGLLSWLSVLVLLYPARKSNGYRGLHGIFSGTRVVRLSGDVVAKPLNRFEITAPVALSESEAERYEFDAYQVLGRFREEPQGESVLLAKDPELDRHVWIFKDVASDSFNPIRKHLKRPRRLRVIAADSTNGKTWYCTEAIPGLPLIDVIDRKSCNWQSIRPILRDLAYELDNAAQQNLLPENLSLSQVWIDHAGRIRLLDHMVVPSNSGNDETLSSVDLLLKIIDRTFDHHAFPLHAMTFRNDLMAGKGEPEILDWAGDQLAEMAEKPSTWKWDDRIGMFAISTGLELSVITAAVFCCGFLANIFMFPIWPSCFLAVTGGLVVVGLNGFLLNGGLAIRISGVSVCREKNLRVASRLRCTLRALFGWIPWIGLMTSFVYVVIVEAKTIADNANTVAIDETQVSAGSFLIVAALAFVVTCMGAIWAVFYPPRGVQDVITGTRLVRN